MTPAWLRPYYSMPLPPGGEGMTGNRNSRDAMTPDGRVVIFERVMPEHITRPEPATRADVAMLALTAGRERTAAEYRGLLAVAGLTLTRVVPTGSPRDVLEAERAQ